MFFLFLLLTAKETGEIVVFTEYLYIFFLSFFLFFFFFLFLLYNPSMHKTISRSH